MQKKGLSIISVFQVKMDKTKNAAKIQCTICMEDYQVNEDS